MVSWAPSRLESRLLGRMVAVGSGGEAGSSDRVEAGVSAAGILSWPLGGGLRLMSGVLGWKNEPGWSGSEVRCLKTASKLTVDLSILCCPLGGGISSIGLRARALVCRWILGGGPGEVVSSGRSVSGVLLVGAGLLLSLGRVEVHGGCILASSIAFLTCFCKARVLVIRSIRVSLVVGSWL